MERTRDGEYWGHGRLFGIVRLGDDSAYCFAAARAPEGERGTPEEEKAALLAGVEGWADPIPELVEATPAEAILRHDLYDRPPKGPWGKKRVTTLGDAAHPMLPNLGQGACQAIEDAAALADGAAPRPAAPRRRDPGRDRPARLRERAHGPRAHGRPPVAAGLPTRRWPAGRSPEGVRNLLMRSLPKRRPRAAGGEDHGRLRVGFNPGSEGRAAASVQLTTYAVVKCPKSPWREGKRARRDA